MWRICMLACGFEPSASLTAGSSRVKTVGHFRRLLTVKHFRQL